MHKQIMIPLMAVLMSGCVNPATQTNFPAGIDFGPLKALGDTTFQITATISPEYAYNKGVTWTINWDGDDGSATDDDAFKIEKTVTDYVTLTTSGATATLNLVAPFASQILIKAEAVADPLIYDTCTVNYIKRYHFTGIDNTPTLAVASGNIFTNPIGKELSIGTKAAVAAGTLTYEYGANFYWAGGGLGGSIVKATDLVEVTGKTNPTVTAPDLFGSMAYKLSQQTGATVDFGLISHIMPAENSSNSFIDEFYNSINTLSSSHSGADLYFPFIAKIDGVLPIILNSLKVTEDSTVFMLAKIDTSDYQYSPQSLVINVDNFDF